MFDFIPKPKIGIYKEVQISKTERKQQHFDKFLNVVEAFDSLIGRYLKDDIDSKSLSLISKMGEETRQIFLISTLINRDKKKSVVTR